MAKRIVTEGEYSVFHSDSGIPESGSVEEMQFYGFDPSDPSDLADWEKNTGEHPVVRLEG
jgi:hypothetical protein